MLVITSKEAILALESLQLLWQEKPLIAVSEATAAFAQKHGGTIAAIGQGYGKSLYELLLHRYADRRVLFACGKVLASDFAQRLQESGVAIDIVAVYETRCNETHDDLVIEDNAVLAFTSPSGVKCFMQRHRFTSHHKIAVIGETTKAALPLHVNAEVAHEPTVKSLIALAKTLAF